MKYSEGNIGRIFLLRLEDGDHLPDIIEKFAKTKKIYSAVCFLVGGVDEGGTIVTGPENGKVRPTVPMLFQLIGEHEIFGLGTIISDDNGKPVLHMHAAMGRSKNTHTGCIRPGIDIWLIGELVIIEIISINAVRKKDLETGFGLLEIIEE